MSRTCEEISTDVQVAHLFIKAADQGIISPSEVGDALRSLFPGQLVPRRDGDVEELLAALERDTNNARYSEHVRRAWAVLLARYEPLMGK